MRGGARGRHAGFTLLEVLLAMTLMGLVVVGAFSALQSSVNAEIRSQDADRIALLARRQMDTLLLNHDLPKSQLLQGQFPAEWASGSAAGWRATVTPYESAAMPPAAGARMLERIALEIWVRRDGRERVERFESFRPAAVTPADVQLFLSGAGAGALRQ
jgi:prepilin-type N-terminal cleavage/methylation domain-containing protein